MRFLSCLALVVPSLLAAQSTLIRGVRLFDGVRVQPRADVLIDSGRVLAVGPRLRAPSGASIVDGSGKTLLPGFIDAHTHSFGRPSLEQAAAFGVTTHLDQFTAAPLLTQLRAEQGSGKALGRADLFSAGVLVTAPRGHGTQFGLPIPTLERAADAQAFVDARIAEGSDWIKIVYDAGHAYGRTIPTLSREVLVAAIRAAKARGKLALVHVGDQQSALEALEAGADGLVHIFIDTLPAPRFVRLARSRNAFVIPTLAVSASLGGASRGAALLGDSAIARLLDDEALASLRRTFTMPRSRARYEHAESAVRALHAAGVTILAGTDAPNPGTTYGASIHQELEQLVGAGLTPTQALAAATSAPAVRFGLRDRGRIARGSRADLVLVEGDPTRDIRATRHIVQVWKGGVPVDREVVARRLAAARAAAAQARDRAAASVGDGTISSFDGDSVSPTAAFGAGWTISTDAVAGGTSAATLTLVRDGAAGSARALEVRGTVAAGAPFPWSGVAFWPGERPMAAANLSAKKEIVFQARGDGQEYQLMLFSQRRGFMPTARTFVAGPEWREVVLPFSLYETDGSDVMGLVFAAAGAPRAYRFQIDEVRLR